MPFAPIYDCPSCGEVWRVNVLNEADLDRQLPPGTVLCADCGNPVGNEKKDSSGRKIVHSLTDDELREINKEVFYHGD